MRALPALTPDIKAEEKSASLTLQTGKGPSPYLNLTCSSDLY